MGRFVSGAGGNVPRKQSIRLLASNPSVPIPSWARVAYITGCGGGAGGSSTAAVSSAASANRFPLLLSPGATTMSVTIGAGGVGGGSGAAGGDTIIAIDSVNVLRLTGGPASSVDVTPAFWSVSASTWRPWALFPQAVAGIDQIMPATLGRGSINNSSTGGSSAFGAGGNAGPATGYGAGGGINGAGSPGFLLIEFKEAS